MSLTFDLENIHQKNMEDLYNDFQSEEVKTFYITKRKELEKNAVIEDFVPTLTYKEVKEIMKNR